MNSPYNKRQNKYEEQVVRGNILTIDGEMLAETKIDSEGNETRVYPYNNLFAHVIGYSTNGRSGLESAVNFQLLTSHAFALEQVKKEFQDEKNMGDNIITTLDVELQQTAYDALGDHRGAVVVMEPKTGKILAMVSKPDFDPNGLSDIWESLVADDTNSNLLNRATQGMYPPGSTFKIVTTLAYLREHGGSTDGFSFLCEGEITKENHTIHCYSNSVHGQEDLPKAFAKSCNSAYANLGVELENKSMIDAAEELQFNKKLSLELPYNKSKFTLENNSGVPLAMQTSIGQGNTLVSPMHMAMITSAIANDGNLMKPYLVDSIESYTGEKVEETSPKMQENLMTSREAATLRELMQAAVTDGTAAALNGQSYTAAGKTGTADHGDMTEAPHSWFVGFSNVEDPDIVVSIIAERSGTGSDVAVPIAKEIFDAYYN